MNKEKVYVEDLKPGMFVYELDRPWLDTPFLIQGFLIQSEEQIEQLGKHCEFVYVDPVKSTRAAYPQRVRPVAAATAEAPAPRSVIPGKRVIYEDKTTVTQELHEAKPVRNLVSELVGSIREDIRKGEVLDRKRLADAVAAMVDSIIRNPNALMLLTKLKEKDAAAYGYSIDVAICLLAFGRHLGFSKDNLEFLGLGGLLLDIGKVRVPEELLTKRTALTPAEHKVLKNHVQHGVDILKGSPGIATEVLEMVATHHEREDGSGFPRGLKGDEIGIYGKMAAIVDCYEDLTVERPFAPAMSPHVALQLLHQWRGRFFEEFLVDEFVHCIGLYPAGSLVELNTGEVAVIMAHNPKNRLKPKVLLILDPKKTPYPTNTMVDLDAPGSLSESREIRRGLEYGMYGIDPAAYYDRVS
ncbi:MAG: DUF3391 domain-containing protein [Betaproteobacteria bacterium]|nr:DUF3391 domain-containing protein [Betaproteobacteria bacterium]